MKLTISQEGANPITIRNYRSNESGTTAGIPLPPKPPKPPKPETGTTAGIPLPPKPPKPETEEEAEERLRKAAEREERVLEIGKHLARCTQNLCIILRKYFPSYRTCIKSRTGSKQPTNEEINEIFEDSKGDYASTYDTTRSKHLSPNEIIEILSKDVAELESAYKEFNVYADDEDDVLIRAYAKQIEHRVIVPTLIECYRTQYADISFVDDLIAYTQNCIRYLRVVDDKHISNSIQKVEDEKEQRYRQYKQEEMMKRGAIGAAAVAAVLIARLIGGTIYNRVKSIGTFSSGEQMLQSRELQQNVEKIRNKFAKQASANAVKTDPRAKSKSSFLAWLLGQGDSKKIMDNIYSMGMLVKVVNGVAVSVTTLKGKGEGTSSKAKVILATAHGYDKNGKLISLPLARGFLAAGNVVNLSRECVDVFYGNGNLVLTKNQLMKRAKSVESLSLTDKIKYIDMTTI